MADKRARRLGYFVREIKRAVLNMCVDHDVSLRYLDEFMDEFFLSLDYHESEYPVELLVAMLRDDALVEHTFRRYAELLT
jgi:hypothetical protein